MGVCLPRAWDYGDFRRRYRSEGPEQRADPCGSRLVRREQRDGFRGWSPTVGMLQDGRRSRSNSTRPGLHSVARRRRILGACTTHLAMFLSGVKIFGLPITTRKLDASSPLSAVPHRVDPGRLVGPRRAGRARGVPRRGRALGPERRPGLPLCRVQGSGASRPEGGPGSGASAGARRRACGAPRRPRPSERSGLDQFRRAAEDGRRVDFAQGPARRCPSVRTSSKSCSARRRSRNGLRRSVETSSGFGRSSRSSGKP